MLPNLLATRRGRLAAFFALYMTEGIPLGFAATAIAFHLRKMGVGPAEIGAFVGSFYLPWAFKWAFGPLVDVLRSRRFGHRRGWILLTQLVMAATLAGLVLVELPSQLALFTAVLLVHNTFAAMQDVAIDALACNSLHEDERGVANGMMFAGAAIGQAVGGSGVLFLTAYTGFQPTFFFVALAILAVTTLVVLPMKEAAVEALTPAGAGLRHAAAEMRRFAVESFRAFLGTRGAFAGLGFALLPSGAMALGLALRSNLTAELGFDEAAAARLELWSNVLAALAMVGGGWLSDKLGRRRTLFVYLALMSLPTAWLAWRLQQLGHVMPQPLAPGSAIGAAAASVLWATTLIYNIFMGLMYGTRSAIMMDVTDPKVAATQFTAYMAMMNLAIAYSATWQGLAVEALGYPATLALDALLGLACLALLPLIRPPRADRPEPADAAARRARAVAAVLALACLAWWPFHWGGDALGALRKVLETFFTLGFVAAAVMLLAATALLPRRTLTRAAPWVALGLLLASLRNFAPSVAGGLGLPAADVPGVTGPAVAGVALLASALLLALARDPWQGLARRAAPG
jgi:PAT family beta-lactamase induction signal transducer AmpG